MLDADHNTAEGEQDKLTVCCILKDNLVPWLGGMVRKGPFFHPAPKPRKSPWERGWLKERYMEYLGSLRWSQVLNIHVIAFLKEGLKVEANYEKKPP